MNVGFRTHLLGGAAMFVLVAACTSNTTQAPAGSPPADTTDTPPEEQTAAAPEYPEGPYGTKEGQILGDLDFVGYFRTETSGLATSAGLADLKISDVRKQAGEPKYAVVHLSAFWCGICRSAVDDLVSQYPKLAAKAIFVDIMVEGDTPDDVATKANLDSWVKGLSIPYTVLRDPDAATAFRSRTKLGQRKTAYLVELSTMKILKKSASDYSEILAALEAQE